MSRAGVIASARVAPGTPPSSPEFVGAAVAEATSVTMPAHSVGDLLIVVAFRFDATIPTLPAGWTSSSTSTTNTIGRRIGWKVATEASGPSGTWTNAAAVFAAVWRGFTIVGASASSASYAANNGHPAITLTTPASSWVGTLSSPDSGQAPVPSGTVSRWTDGENRWADTNGAPGSWTGLPGSLFLGASIEMGV